MSKHSKHSKFSPELLITAPRPSSAVPNDEGKVAIYTVSTYDLDTHADFSEVKLLNLETGESTRYTNDPKESSFRWLSGSSLLWQREGKNNTELWIGDAYHNTRPYLAGTIDAKPGNLKTKSLDNGDIALVFTAPADAEQNLYNILKADKTHTTAREWTHSRPKRWDSYVDQYRSVIWYTVLKLDLDSKQWQLSTKGPVNALRGTGLVVPLYSNSQSSPDFDISSYGIVFATADPVDIEWRRSQSCLYFIPLSTFEETDLPALKKIKVPDHADIAAAPRFAPRDPVIAFLVDQDSEEWSQKSIVLLNTETLSIVLILRTVSSFGQSQNWDVFPDDILWANDGASLYLIADHQAKTRVFLVVLPTTTVQDRAQSVEPVALEIPGSVSSLYQLGRSSSENRLLATSSSFIDQGLFTIVTPPVDNDPASQSSRVIYSSSSHGAYFGISDKQVESITFPGGPDGKTPVQCWIVKPSRYDATSVEKHPLFIFMHGGPNSASKDAWTWRWNAVLLAEQGYIVAIPNFTGSDSFGAEFARAVALQWGGHPYHDVERCFNWIEQNLSTKCDVDRAVAAGGSYGGYLALFLAGQPLAKRLRALVSHDGIFDVVSELLSDDLGQVQELTRSFGSPYFSNAPDAGRDEPSVKEIWRRYNPAEYLSNWSTPLLLIHSDRDFRCPITAASAAYTVCRMKGIDTRYLNFPDENHFVLGRENSLVWYQNVIGWCNKYVGMEDGLALQPARNEPQWLGRREEGRVLDVDV